MLTYIADIIPRLQQFSQELDNQTLLVNQHWVAVDNIANIKTIYIFRSNNELLISTDGRVVRGRWEYLGNRSLLIDKNDESYLFKHGFFDENVLALKVDNKNEYAFLINENKFVGEINSVEKVLDFLREKYLSYGSFPIKLRSGNSGAMDIDDNCEGPPKYTLKDRRTANNVLGFFIVFVLIVIFLTVILVTT